jgi:hypothetical protein
VDTRVSRLTRTHQISRASGNRQEGRKGAFEQEMQKRSKGQGGPPGRGEPDTTRLPTVRKQPGAGARTRTHADAEPGDAGHHINLEA